MSHRMFQVLQQYSERVSLSSWKAWCESIPDDKKLQDICLIARPIHTSMHITDLSTIQQAGKRLLRASNTNTANWPSVYDFSNDVHLKWGYVIENQTRNVTQQLESRLQAEATTKLKQLGPGQLEEYLALYVKQFQMIKKQDNHLYRVLSTYSRNYSPTDWQAWCESGTEKRILRDFCLHSYGYPPNTNVVQMRTRFRAGDRLRALKDTPIWPTIYTFDNGAKLQLNEQF